MTITASSSIAVETRSSCAPFAQITFSPNASARAYRAGVDRYRWKHARRLLSHHQFAPLQNQHRTPEHEKVQSLQGVSYDLKSNGQHQIGLIAEDVGEVIPEVVSYEKNGVDAQGVDYGRLTALLVEATKEQQVEIERLVRANREKEQQIHALVKQVRELRKVQQQVAFVEARLARVEARGGGIPLAHVPTGPPPPPSTHEKAGAKVGF